jgi:RecB family exonuclease
VCTAVAGDEELDLRPSRFLAELGVAVPDEPEPAPRVLSLPALVAELRRSVCDPDQQPAVRAAAADLLAELADEVPSADPQAWWGLVPWTTRETPLVAADAPVELSPSQVEALQRCPLQWFLRRRVGAEGRPTTSQGVGMLLHALASSVADEPRVDLEAMQARLDAVWEQLEWEAPWFAERERRVAHEALRRFAAWHRERGLKVVGAELPFDLHVAGARVKGQVDRLERDSQGRGVVVDLKTSRTPPTDAEAAENPQLGLYQLAVAEGAWSESVSGAGGAALAQLRAGSKEVRVQSQPALEPDEHGRTWVHDLLQQLVAQVTSEQFPAQPHSGCDNCEVRRACPARPEGASVC